MSPADWSAERHHQCAAEALKQSPPDYNRYHANIAASYHPVSGGRVLVVGCNRGEDCRQFVEFGAAEVVGLDVMDEIGVNFRHPRASYVKETAEAMPFADGRFDMIFCFATMEHVPDIERAFAEMARVCSTGGVIYSVAAPLWNTRQGPHWGDAFNEYPWAHLRLTRQEMIAFMEHRRLERPEAPYLPPEQIRYMTDRRYFNKRPARDYLAACTALSGVEIIRNDVEEQDPSGVDQAVVAELGARGYDRRELFGLTHTFIARAV
jgi:SAM-dependent methyltransferase